MVSFSWIIGLFVTLLVLPSSMEAFVMDGFSLGVQKQRSSRILVAADDMAAHASPLPLSASDMSRLTALKERHQTIPIMILESILPGQKIAFQSNDPTLAKLIAYTAKTGQEIGVLGFNPISGKPLSIGVTVPVTKDATVHFSSRSSLTVQVQGNKRFEIQGQPYMDVSESFFLANVELIDERPEPELSCDDQEIVLEISERLPDLVEEWLELLLLKKNHKNTQEQIGQLLMEMGDMPESPTGRAIWIASLINPTQAFWKTKDICMEIRPAMLACRNDRDRMILAHAALLSSINQLK